MKKNFLILMAAVAMLSSNVFAETKVGDIDANGKITATDSAYLLKKVKYADFKLPNEVSLGTSWFDMDGDGVLTANDAVCVLKKTVNKTEELPTENIRKTFQTSADDFECGIYTKNIIIGNVTITATEENPVKIEDIEAYEDGQFTLGKNESTGKYEIIDGTKKFVRCFKLNENNIIYVNTNSWHNPYDEGKEFVVDFFEGVRPPLDEYSSSHVNYKLFESDTGNEIKTARATNGLSDVEAMQAYIISGYSYYGLVENKKYTLIPEKGEYLLRSIEYYD